MKGTNEVNYWKLLITAALLYYGLMYFLNLFLINSFYGIGLIMATGLSVGAMIILTTVLLKKSGLKYKWLPFVFDVCSGIILYAILLFFSFYVFTIAAGIRNGIGHFFALALPPILFIVILVLLLFIKYHYLFLKYPKKNR